MTRDSEERDEWNRNNNNVIVFGDNQPDPGRWKLGNVIMQDIELVAEIWPR